MAAAVASNHKARRRQVWMSVFPEVSQPTPQATPIARFPDQGQPFGGGAPPPPSFPTGGGGGQRLPLGAAHGAPQHPHQQGFASSNRGGGSGRAAPGWDHQPPPVGLGLGLGRLGSPSLATTTPRSAADDQTTYDRAWHVVTSRVALPSTVAAEDSFGTLAPESQLLALSQSQSQPHDPAAEADFQTALRLVLDAKTALPRASHTEDLLGWHTQQVRQHFAQHVIPMLSACADGPALAVIAGGDADDAAALHRQSDQHMVALVSSIRTLEAAFRLYEYGLSLILRGFRRAGGGGQRRQRRRHATDSDEAIDVEMEDATLAAEDVARRFRKDIRSLVENSAPPQLMVSTRVVLLSLIGRILGIPESSTLLTSGPGRPQRQPAPPRPAAPDDNDMLSIAARQRLHELVSSLADVGLAGERFQILFAEVMDKMMSDFVDGAFARAWISGAGDGQESDEKNLRTAGASERRSRRSAAAPSVGFQSSCIATLDHWVENHFARLAHEVLRLIDVDQQQPDGPGVSLADVKKWKDIGVGRLAALRISELFEIVLHWPRSRSGIDDLRASVTTPERRLQLTDAFSAALQTRLLHSSRSTLEILQVYVAMIRTFHALDQSKVLLSRVVPSLQLYLCQREDAIRRVVTGLLASPEEAPAEATHGHHASGADEVPATAAEPVGKDTRVLVTANADSLVELALILNDPAQQRRQVSYEDDDLDWNDMDWVPDPVDAGVNYKRPRSEDVIGTLISALGSEDVFIKEFQNIIAERLLSAQLGQDRERKVLSLLKRRFGDGALQNCDVMLRDIQDSKHLDSLIRGGKFVARFRNRQPADAPQPEELEYGARILSRLFWPSIARESFLLPKPVAVRQMQYEKRYEEHKSSRRLSWLDHLGQATVELELEDRTIITECKTFEAAVIYAFQDPEDDDDNDDERGRRGGGDKPKREVHRSLEELQNMLQMDEDLVLQALDFWVGFRVLRRVGTTGSYTVMETLSPSSPPSTSADRSLGTTSAGGGATGGSGATGSGGGGPAIDPKLKHQRTVYWQFIVGMLTNSAASMPLAQIAMMMKMMIAEGFPWSNEELQEFLAEKVASGELEVVGGKYKLAKK